VPYVSIQNKQQTTNKRGREPWRTVLYEVQAYGDDHVDAKFLQELSKTENVKNHSFYFLAGNSVVSSKAFVPECH
jgi:hypothetical protein